MTDILCTGCRAGWEKHPASPVLGGDLGTCFDISVLRDEENYRMYFSWRPRQSIALTSSADGVVFDAPTIVVSPRVREDGWEDDANRPGVLYRDGVYHMWYTGQFRPGKADGSSHIFYATSIDGIHFDKVVDDPVLAPELPWEDVAVMCPHVLYDGEKQVYRMWYSGGEQYEPNAIGYAESADGITWTKHPGNPILAANPELPWEGHKVTACQVFRSGDWFIMFYIGFMNEDYAQIGIARSRDGITGWQRHPLNPIIAPTPGAWDENACYKPCALFDGEKWLLWYNGRRASMEQIGLAIHMGEDLGFEEN